jgi:hypothetical protein
MTYKTQLYPWCIIRPLPNMRSPIVGRFRRRVDAEGHLQILRRLIPSVAYEIMFDISPEDSDSKDLTPPTPLPYKGMGEKDIGSPLKSRRGAGGEVNRGVKPS